MTMDLRSILVGPAAAPQSARSTIMNCWLSLRKSLRPAVPRPISRGELELPRAVLLSIDGGQMRVRVIRVRGPCSTFEPRTSSVTRRLSRVNYAVELRG